MRILIVFLILASALLDGYAADRGARELSESSELSQIHSFGSQAHIADHHSADIGHHCHFGHGNYLPSADVLAFKLPRSGSVFSQYHAPVATDLRTSIRRPPKLRG